jgi:predicted RNA-binding Zn-ribbon protein involved in translation (DUF1610 family)
MRKTTVTLEWDDDSKTSAAELLMFIATDVKDGSLETSGSGVMGKAAIIHETVELPKCPSCGKGYVMELMGTRMTCLECGDLWDVEKDGAAALYYTCTNCADNGTCEYAYEDYNTNGDCLKEK